MSRLASLRSSSIRLWRFSSCLAARAVSICSRMLSLSASPSELAELVLGDDGDAACLPSGQGSNEPAEASEAATAARAASSALASASAAPPAAGIAFKPSGALSRSRVAVAACTIESFSSNDSNPTPNASDGETPCIAAYFGAGPPCAWICFASCSS